MLKMLLLVSMLFSISLAKVSKAQIDRIGNIYKIGKSESAKDGTTFEKALSSIYLQESSAGMMVVGDKYEDKYYYKHYNSIVYLDNKKSSYTEDGQIYFTYKNKYRKKVYVEKGVLKPLHKSSLGGFQIKLSTAKAIIKKNKMKQYYYLLENDTKLINKLLIDYKFSAKLALKYLIMAYHEASERKMWNPYFKSISRYNGGWKNVTYYTNVMNRMKTINELISLGKI